MKIQRIVALIIVLFLGNLPFLVIKGWLPDKLLPLLVIAAIVGYLIFQVIPAYKRKISFHIQVLSGGYELLLNSAWGLVLEVFILVLQWFALQGGYQRTATLFLSGVVAAALLIFSAYNGVLRIVITSKQLKLWWKILLLTTMWIPIWNFFLVWKVCRTVQKETILESVLEMQDLERAQEQVCKTKYPIVLVHGIFFRDWQLMNYWGRIPEELMKNGASVFYGKQESALPVAESAKEVKRHILDAIEKSGAKKVNVIAHSKGGLDTRYAISCLGMSDYVASLTTINTPHYGCIWAENVLRKIPGGVVKWVAKKYNTVFHILGDQRPDFYEAVKDLTRTRCERLNIEMPDSKDVYYQSVMSVMKKRTSAGFPLNLVYPLVKKAEGENDGLVAVPSAKWGTFLGVKSCEKKRGISHADMIDLMRENIDGFPVREFYIDLVSDLRKRGF